MHSTANNIKKKNPHVVYCHPVKEISYLRTKQHHKLNHRRAGLHTDEACNKERLNKMKLQWQKSSFQVILT